jgi:hypothetical protein
MFLRAHNREGKPAMTIAENAARKCRDAADAELARLYNATGIDLTILPPIMTAEELARALRCSVGALAQERYRNQGAPYIKMGRRVRYARTEVARYLMTTHQATVKASVPPGPTA